MITIFGIVKLDAVRVDHEGIADEQVGEICEKVRMRKGDGEKDMGRKRWS